MRKNMETSIKNQIVLIYKCFYDFYKAGEKYCKPKYS